MKSVAGTGKQEDRVFTLKRGMLKNQEFRESGAGTGNQGKGVYFEAWNVEKSGIQGIRNRKTGRQGVYFEAGPVEKSGIQGIRCRNRQSGDREQKQIQVINIKGYGIIQLQFCSGNPPELLYYALLYGMNFVMAEKYKKKKQKTDGEMDARELADEAVKTYKTYKRFKYQIHIALIFFIVFIYTQIQTIDPAERDTAYSYRRGISCKEARQSYSIDEASKYCEYPPESELIIKKVVGWISLAIGIAFTIQRLRRYRKENQSRK